MTRDELTELLNGYADQLTEAADMNLSDGYDLDDVTAEVREVIAGLTDALKEAQGE